MLQFIRKLFEKKPDLYTVEFWEKKTIVTMYFLASSGTALDTVVALVVSIFRSFAHLKFVDGNEDAIYTFHIATQNLASSVTKYTSPLSLSHSFYLCHAVPSFLLFIRSISILID